MRVMKHPNRHTIRMPGYDYASPGAYFVTICMHDRLHLLGEIHDGSVRMTPAGEMVNRWWAELAQKFPVVALDAHVIMPNHFHGILHIQGVDAKEPANATNLGGIVGWFKTMTTNEYIRGVKQCGWSAFDKYFWQRNYWEHVIRSASSLKCIRRYIELNPRHWADDIENPDPDWVEARFDDL